MNSNIVRVAIKVPFTLSGSVSASGSWSTWIELNGSPDAGGNVSYGFSVNSPTAPPGGVQESGVLPPGTYTLRATLLGLPGPLQTLTSGFERPAR